MKPLIGSKSEGIHTVDSVTRDAQLQGDGELKPIEQNLGGLKRTVRGLQTQGSRGSAHAPPRFYLLAYKVQGFPELGRCVHPMNTHAIRLGEEQHC